MSGYSSSSRPMCLASSASTTSTAYPSGQGPTSSPPSSPPSLTHSASSPGSPVPEENSNENPAATFANKALNLPAYEQAAGYAKQLTRPSESDYMVFERDLLDPENAKAAVTAMHEFLAAMEKATTPPPPKYYNSRQTLQAYLIQLQLVAGIPIDKIQPMPEFAPKSNQSERVVQRHQMPAYITITKQGTFVPEIPPAQFNGTLDPLPLNAGLPSPVWVNRAVENLRNQMDSNATSSTTTVNTHGPQPTQRMMDPNSTGSKSAKNVKDFSTYFSSAKEQEIISQFFAEHFSTGSGILNLESAEVDKLVDDSTDSDYATDYWSETNDA